MNTLLTKLFLIFFLLIAGSACAGEITIFSDTCTESSVDTVLSSHTPEIGTWGTGFALAGTPTATIEAKSSTDQCVIDETAGVSPIAYEASPAPTKDIYTVYWTYKELGVANNTDNIAFLVNEIDKDNYYSCHVGDDGASTDVRITENNAGTSTVVASASSVGSLNNQNMSCKIDYSASDPVITFDYGIGTLNYTDTTTKLTKTNQVAIACGIKSGGSSLACSNTQGVDDISITVPRKNVIMMSKGERKWQK